MIGAVRSWADKPRGASSGFEIEDYILARMDLKGMSVRELALHAEIGRSRLHDGLHREADKRVPLRVPEIAAILEALGIKPVEAFLAKEMLQKGSSLDFADLIKIISMVCGIVSGLPEQIITVVSHIDGLGFDDVRPEHGEVVQDLLVKTVALEYQKLVQRRLSRINEF